MKLLFWLYEYCDVFIMQRPPNIRSKSLHSTTFWDTEKYFSRPVLRQSEFTFYLLFFPYSLVKAGHARRYQKLFTLTIS